MTHQVTKFKKIINSLQHLLNPTKDLLEPILEDINKVENQIKLLELIHSGELKIIHEDERVVGNIATPYFKEVWRTKCNKIKYWTEDPGFRTFSYLEIGGTILNNLKYKSQIGLSMRNPKREYKVSKSDFRRYKLKKIKNKIK